MKTELRTDDEIADKLVKTQRLAVVLGIVLVGAGFGLSLIGFWLRKTPFLGHIADQVGSATMAAGLFDLLLTVGFRKLKLSLVGEHLNLFRRYDKINADLDNLFAETNAFLHEHRMENLDRRTLEIFEDLRELHDKLDVVRRKVDPDYDRVMSQVENHANATPGSSPGA